MQDTARPDGPPETGTSAPLLSIGLAVYNGERHLAQAIDSLLAQDVGDFELIISDNASTDATEAICREYAAADPRVRYIRNAENIGAAANYNRVFELSTGRYFMWGSDDDVWDPRFASACIAKLEDSPLAVQCTSRMALIGEDGGPVSDTYEPLDTEGMPVEARAHELVARIRWYEIYSVFRPNVLRETSLFRSGVRRRRVPADGAVAARRVRDGSANPAELPAPRHPQDRRRTRGRDRLRSGRRGGRRRRRHGPALPGRYWAWSLTPTSIQRRSAVSERTSRAR